MKIATKTGFSIGFIEEREDEFRKIPQEIGKRKNMKNKSFWVGVHLFNPQFKFQWLLSFGKPLSSKRHETLARYICSASHLLYLQRSLSQAEVEKEPGDKL